MDDAATTERDPLLGSSSTTVQSERTEKPWYRPRPLWLVPFAITAALCRGMTLAPRTEVFTQLACEELRPPNRHHNTVSHHSNVTVLSTHPNFSLSYSRFPQFREKETLPFILAATHAVRNHAGEGPPISRDENREDSPMVGDPPVECLTDPAVQAGAAKLQTIMTTTIGFLSALTTGWWGQFGDRRGRTKVLACAVAGLLFTDIMFIIASNPPELLKGHAHKLLIFAPVVEGLLGGWPTLQSATFSYISDCTSHGSRAHIFSRFTGVLFVGIAFGPEIAALILHTMHKATIVFYASAGLAFVNLILLLFVFPESLSNDVRARNDAAAREARSKTQLDAQGRGALWRYMKGGILGFVRPLGILAPRPNAQGPGKDWSMTVIAVTLFCHFLTLGIMQFRYLYVERVFSWNAEKISYYITVLSSMRALHLLITLPTVIRLFKPVSPVNTNEPSRGKATPTSTALSSDVKFDLLVAKASLGIDLLSQVLVILMKDASRVLYITFTATSGLGAGLVPALQSVAMSVLLLSKHGEDHDGDTNKGGAEVGQLFGAIAVLQAVGSMILGPMFFGTVYSLTVAQFPKGIFLVAAALLVISVASLLLLRRPRVDVPLQIRVDTRVDVAVDRVRGRSRQSKDIRR